MSLWKSFTNFLFNRPASTSTASPQISPPPANSFASPASTSSTSISGASAPQASSSETPIATTASPTASTMTVAAASSSNSTEKTMSLSAILTALSLVPNLFTVIDQAVQSVEASLANVPGITGSAKLQAAEAKVNAFLAAAGADVAALVNLSGVLTPLINAAVAIFNSTGLFKKATTSAQS